MIRATLLLCCFSLMACGGDDDATETFDAPPSTQLDAAPQAVTAVTCPASPAETVTTPGNFFQPNAVTISVGEIVKLDPSSGHDVIATSPAGAFSVTLGGEGCFRFDAPGTYRFKCNPHGFTGAITVE